MKKKEWIKYFKAINKRKPTKDEIDLAITEGEYEVTLFDNVSRFIKRKIPSRKIRILIVASIIFLTIVTIFFSSLKRSYHLYRSETYNKQYQEVVDKYQKALDNNDKGKEFQAILEQPSRNPSYAQIDSNYDGKDELYIAFIDENDEYEIESVGIIAIYEIQSGKVKHIKRSELQISDEELDEELSESYLWESFDVENLVTMNLEELSEGNLSSIVGTWKNKYGYTFEIEESGYLYRGDSLGYPLQDITVSSDGSATGFMNRNLTAGMTPNTTDYVTFIPAGISISGGENADITKDRIGLSGTIAGYNDPQVYYRVEE